MTRPLKFISLPSPAAAKLPDGVNGPAGCGAATMSDLPKYGTISARGGSGGMPVTTHRPMRGSDVEAWIRRHRETWVSRASGTGYRALNELLDDYRLHADTGTPLSRPAHEGDDVEPNA